MSLNASLSKFKSELSETASRNAAYSRPSSTAPARTSTPKPTDSTSKRTHDTAFPSTTANTPAAAAAAAATSTGHAGSELLTQVWNAVHYLKEKDLRPVPFEQIVNYLSLPNDLQKNTPLIRRALASNERVEVVSVGGKDLFKYRPQHPVTNAEELTTYLARQPTAQGIPVRELKDGWPECNEKIDELEKEGAVLVLRNKKDNTPKIAWTDSPSYHILSSAQAPQKADSDFIDIWSKTKLPASEVELRSELEKAGLTPTSQVKEVLKGDSKKKEKRRVNRKGGKTTNSHMLGILKDYSKR